MTTSPTFDVFISYATPDRAWVAGYLRDALDRAGVRVLTEEAFALGHPRVAEFERAVARSRRVVLVLSPAYLADEAAGFVELLAQTYGLDTASWPVIPMLLEPVALPTRLAMLTSLDVTDPADREAAVARLTETLSLPPPPPTPIPACPYPGMRPFTTAEAPLFHGREAETEEMVQRLHAQRGAGQRFLAVIGPSGSGKSSLVFAGLIPALVRSALFGTLPWQVLSLRPGTSPMTTSTTVIRGEGTAPGPTMRELADTPTTAPRLLVVDQFEELFTTTERSTGQEADAFEEVLGQLARMPDSYVMLTARADFYPELMGSALWPLIQGHRVEVAPLDEAGLRQAIVRPAERVGVYVEGALVERLVADAAGEPGVLPLVQQTLVLLWERLERRFLPLRAYEALVLPRSAYGGATGRTGLEVAVARHADAVLADLSPPQQVIARRIFLRLIQFGEGRADTRRQRTVDELRTRDDDPALVAATLEHLAANRLLTLSGGEEGGARRVDLAHEALIGGWPQIREWIQAHGEMETIRRDLVKATSAWKASRGDASYLLAGQRLRHLESWVTLWDSELGIKEREFIAASIAASRRQVVRRMIAFAAIALLMVVGLVIGGQWGYGEYMRRTSATELVRIPSEVVTIGTDDPDADPGESLLREIELRPFRVERFEVSNNQYRACVQYGPCTPPLMSEQFDDSALGSLPVVWVSGEQARIYCGWHDRRLLTSAEFEYLVGLQQETPPGEMEWTMEEGPIAVDALPAGDPPFPGVAHLLDNVQELLVQVPRDCVGEACQVSWHGGPQDFVWMGGAYDQFRPRVSQQTTIGPESPDQNVGFRCADD